MNWLGPAQNPFGGQNSGQIQQMSSSPVQGSGWGQGQQGGHHGGFGGQQGGFSGQGSFGGQQGGFSGHPGSQQGGFGQIPQGTTPTATPYMGAQGYGPAQSYNGQPAQTYGGVFTGQNTQNMPHGEVIAPSHWSIQDNSSRGFPGLNPFDNPFSHNNWYMPPGMQDWGNYGGQR